MRVKPKAFLSEESKKILGNDKNLVYAYSMDGNDYFVSSDVFHDPVQRNIHGLLLVVQKKGKELVMHLPCLIVSKNDGFSKTEVKDIRSFISQDQLSSVFRFCPGFKKKYLAGA